MTRWSKADDKKLFEQFRRGGNRGGIDPKKLRPKDMHEVIRRFYPEKTFENFGGLFRRKARAFLLDQELSGSRKSKSLLRSLSAVSPPHLTAVVAHAEAAKKKANKDEESEDEDEDDSEHDESGEEDEDLAADADIDEEELEEEEEEEEVAMPPRKAKGKAKSLSPQRPTPAKKKAPPPPPPDEDDDVEDITAGVSQLGVKESYSMDAVFPFMMWVHTIDEREHCSVHFYVPCLLRHHYRPWRHPTNPRILQVGFVVPSSFPSKTRLNEVHGNEANFNASTHMNTAYKALVEKVRDHCDDGNPDITFLGKPQEVEIPFEAEEDIIWEVQYHGYDEDDLTDALGGLQFTSTLAVNLLNVVKPKNTNQGGI